ncbi:hypothetical protein IF1G_08735 [Cordyceps javanica]|uniref:Uncharacterized protein n=1 Tax=Cordyceps javanica TaxID=43265 RepID=A0A545UTL6_9HYPO|nr:hypothetical protein IF1G_08735 [Cordyceps javanica]
MESSSLPDITAVMGVSGIGDESWEHAARRSNEPSLGSHAAPGLPNPVPSSQYSVVMYEYNGAMAVRIMGTGISSN